VIDPLPAAPATPKASVTKQPDCLTPTGTIEVTAPLGTNLEYSIDGTNYQVAPIFSNLQPGTYSVTVRNSDTRCVSAPFNVTVNAVPALPAAPIANPTQPGCNTSTGSVALSGLPSSGAWTLNPGNIAGTGSTFTISNVTSGTYDYTVADAKGCTSLPTRVTINIPPTTPATPVGVIGRQPDCLSKTGAITVTSPVGNLTYSINGGAFQSAVLFDNLNPGTYSITARDAVAGCVSQPSSTYDITTPLLPSRSPIPGLNERYCEGDTAVVPVRALGENLLWYDNATGGTGSATAPIPSTESSGKVTYYVTQQLPGYCESRRIPVEITVLPLPDADAGGDKEIIEGQKVEIGGLARGNGITLIWTPGTGLNNANIERPTASPERTTTYMMTVTTQDGCKSADSMTVVVKPPKEVDIPNVFSPNGDGVNDRWVITHIEEYPEAEVQIFNRYGSMVYERKGYNNAEGWDGKNKGADIPVGAYYYIIRLNSKKKALTGTTSVIR
jgi:gliding motility-associated-like protein